MRPITSKIVKDPKDPKREVCETMVIWGKASRDMKLEYTKGSETSPPKPKVTFGVCYEDKRFMNVISVGECQQTNIAQRVKKGDYVLIAGRWSSKAYTNKNGESKTWDELRIDYIEILKDGFREAVSDAMADALASTMEQGYFKEKADLQERSTGHSSARSGICASRCRQRKNRNLQRKKQGKARTMN